MSINSAFVPVDNDRITFSENVLCLSSPDSSSVSRTEINKAYKAKIMSKNRDCYQQSFLMYLLTKLGYSIQLRRLYKKSTVGRQLLSVKTITKGDKIFYTESSLTFDNTDLKAKRRNIDGTVNNTMLNLIKNDSNVEMKEKKAKTTTKTVGMLRFKKIKVDGHLYTEDDINLLGSKINKYLVENLTKNDFMYSTVVNESLCN